jgi:hypothetical protein
MELVDEGLLELVFVHLSVGHPKASVVVLPGQTPGGLRLPHQVLWHWYSRDGITTAARWHRVSYCHWMFCSWAGNFRHSRGIAGVRTATVRFVWASCPFVSASDCTGLTSMVGAPPPSAGPGTAPAAATTCHPHRASDYEVGRVYPHACALSADFTIQYYLHVYRAHSQALD